LTDKNSTLHLLYGREGGASAVVAAQNNKQQGIIIIYHIIYLLSYNGHAPNATEHWMCNTSK